MLPGAPLATASADLVDAGKSTLIWIPSWAYFSVSHVDEWFPGGGATRLQWSFGAVVTAVAEAGLQIVHLAEFAEPFWRMGGASAAAWTGRLPNSFALLARRTNVVEHVPDDRERAS